MRILYIAEYYPPNVMGGGEINLELIARHMALSGAEVHVLTGRVGDGPHRERRDGVEVHRSVPMPPHVDTIASGVKRVYALRRFTAAYRKLREQHEFDVVHLIGSCILLAQMLRRHGVTPVATVESYPALSPTGNSLAVPVRTLRESVRAVVASEDIGMMRNRWFIRWNPIAHVLLYWRFAKGLACLRQSRVIAISRHVQRLLREEGIQSTVIPNIVDPPARMPPRRVQRRPVLLYLGSYVPFKGPQVVLEAAKGLPVRCEFYGSGMLQQSLAQSARRPGVDAGVNGRVPYEQTWQLYRSADIVVYPSLWAEPFGRIPVEAMACGTPVIASDIGGISETVDTRAGILVPPGDVDALRSAIKRLLENPGLRRSMGRHGPAVAQKYRGAVVCEMLLRAYRDHAGRKPARPSARKR